MQQRLGLQQGYHPIVSSREHLSKFVPVSQDVLPARTMKDSFTSALLPITTDKLLKDKYVGYMGNIRVGRLQEDMDLFAVWVVHNHTYLPDLPEGTPLPYTFVTILVDKIDFTDVIPHYKADIRLNGHVSWVGKSSVEAIVWLEQKVNNEWLTICKSIFLLACRDPTNTKAAPINPLLIGTEEERQLNNEGVKRHQRRMQMQKDDLLKVEPNDYEQRLIHDLFVKSVDLNSKTFNKRILPANYVWMEEAEMTNIIFSHPEDRNAHNKIFGGFLMRNAYELSYALALSFCKRRPKIEHITDISFHQPVEVSSLIHMQAHVIYTEVNYMEIVVIADVVDHTTKEGKTTNSFYYTYSTHERVAKVMPKTYYEAIWYLDGRRKFRYAMGLDGVNDVKVLNKL